MNAFFRMAVTALLWCVLWAGGPAHAEPASPYARRTLFSLSYGEGRGQVAVGYDSHQARVYTSLQRLRVPVSDTVFLQNGDEVWRFHATDARPTSGKPTSAVLDFIRSFAVTPEGRMLVIHGPEPRQTITVYGTDGARQADAWPNVREQLAAKVPLWVPRDHPFMFDVGADALGNFYICIANQTGRTAVAKLDLHLRVTHVRPGFAVGWDGSVNEFAQGRGRGPNDTLLVYRPGTTQKVAVVLRPPADVPAGEYDNTRHRWKPIKGVTTDRRGFVYLTVLRNRAATIWMRDRQLCLQGDPVVYRFSPKGEYLSHIVLDPVPLDIQVPVAVDPAGNLYHPVFREDRVDIVKEAPVGRPVPGR